jgi:DnaJ-class molecular chaperone
MAKRDYYVVLGISRNECREGIKQAFRELAFRYHPDRAGPHAKDFFQEILEAYNVLSDPYKRTSYDRGLRHGAATEDETDSPTVRYGTSPRPRPEPLVPEHAHRMGDFRVGASAFEDLFERVLASFAGPTVSRRKRVHPLDLVVELTRHEAAQGGSLVVDVPIFWPCPSCRSTGRRLGFACPECDETGLIEETRPVRIYLPSSIRDGTVLSIPVRGLGIHNLYVRVLVRVR